MPKCNLKRFFRKVGRFTADNLGPILLRYAGEVVLELDQLSTSEEYTGAQKRDMAEAMIKLKAKAMGVEARTAAIRLAIESAYIGLSKLGEEIGEVDEAELAAET